MGTVVEPAKQIEERGALLKERLKLAERDGRGLSSGTAASAPALVTSHAPERSGVLADVAIPVLKGERNGFDKAFAAASILRLLFAVAVDMVAGF